MALQERGVVPVTRPGAPTRALARRELAPGDAGLRCPAHGTQSA